MSIIPILQNMRSLLDAGWTQGAFARDRDKNAIGSRDDRAVCWCYQGALYAAMPASRMSWEPIESLLHEVTEVDYLPNYNDDKKRTKAQVLESVDKAIKLAKERGL